MGADESSSGQLISQAGELVKTFVTLDGTGRIANVVTALEVAKDGDAATKTEYVYDAVYTTTVIKMKETNVAWDSSWDI